MMNEDSDSEEEILVYAEFEDSVNIDKYRAIHVLGAAEKKPIIQLDETFFIGKYENALGTYMFFEQDPLIQGKDPLFDKYPEKGVKYVCKTRKLLSMEHAYVTPKEGIESSSQNEAKQTEEEVQPVTFQDLQQATDAFKAYFISEPTSTGNHNSDNKRIEQNLDLGASINKQVSFNDRIESNNEINTIDSSIKSNEHDSSINMTDFTNKQNTDNVVTQSTTEQSQVFKVEVLNRPNSEEMITEST